jgi:hypothetical protein
VELIQLKKRSPYLIGQFKGYRIDNINLYFQKIKNYYQKEYKMVNIALAAGFGLFIIDKLLTKKSKNKEEIHMGLQKQFSKFNKSIHLTKYSKSYEDAREKEHSILESIKVKFKDNGYPVVSNDCFRQGSFATDTAIKKIDGDFDVDRAIVIKKENAPTDPVDCKKAAIQVLEKRGFKNPLIKTPCVTADYINLKLHIDYAIYCVDGSNNYSVAIGKKHSLEKNKEWMYSESKELINWVNSSEHCTGYENLTTEERLQFKRLVRYMKRWRDCRFVEANRKYIYSIGLVVMIKESFRPSVDDNGVENDLEALINTVDYILNSQSYFSSWGQNEYDIEVMTPYSPQIDIFRKHGKSVGTVFRKKLQNLLDKLNKVSEKDSLVEKCELLQEVFGKDFECPSVSSASLEKITSASAGIVIPSQGA